LRRGLPGEHEGMSHRMMKKIWTAALLLTAAIATCQAQESRQDASLSVTGLFAPQITGNGVQLNTSSTIGALVGYRFMLTPRSALQANYSFAQNSQAYRSSSNEYLRVHDQQHEASVGYVYSLNFKNFNPFAEIGVGAVLFHPVIDYGTNDLDAKRNFRPGGYFGGGLAYEISPSFDVRIEYRGFLLKAPDFTLPYKVNRYELLSTPAVGIAYHF
jgi:outer membrane immunogenic protein